MTYIIVGILFIAIIVVSYFLNRRNSEKIKSKSSNNLSDTINPKEYHTKTNRFNDLRAMALGVTAEQLKLALPTDKPVVYGVVMDWEMGGSTATIIAYQTGDASLYLSSGGGIIGGGQHENVNSAAKKLVTLAQTYLEKSEKTEAIDLPATNHIRFYFLTNKGKFTSESEMKSFENNTSSWQPLFEQANNVLTELRMTTEKS